MRHYDHRGHAGNAGDVWKHFLLLEAASSLLIPDSSLVYAESHVGRPDYALHAPGDWVGGIGKCWPLLPHLKNFYYFDILASFNPSRPTALSRLGKPCPGGSQKMRRRSQGRDLGYRFRRCSRLAGTPPQRIFPSGKWLLRCQIFARPLASRPAAHRSALHRSRGQKGSRKAAWRGRKIGLGCPLVVHDGE